MQVHQAHVLLSGREEGLDDPGASPERKRKDAGHFWVQGSAVPGPLDVQDLLHVVRDLVRAGPGRLVEVDDSHVQEDADRPLRRVVAVLAAALRLALNEHLPLQPLKG